MITRVDTQVITRVYESTGLRTGLRTGSNMGSLVKRKDGRQLPVMKTQNRLSEMFQTQKVRRNTVEIMETMETKKTKQSQKTNQSHKTRKAKKGYGFGSWDIYIRKMLKNDQELYEGATIGKPGLAVMNSLLNDIFERIASQAGKLARINKKVTVTSRDIEGATKLLLGDHIRIDGLCIHATKEAQKAVRLFFDVERAERLKA